MYIHTYIHTYIHNRYPENTAQMELVTSCAMRCGFSGGKFFYYIKKYSIKKFTQFLYVPCAVAFRGVKILKSTPYITVTYEMYQVLTSENFFFCLLPCQGCSLTIPTRRARKSTFSSFMPVHVDRICVNVT